MQLHFPYAQDPQWPRAVFDPTHRYRYWWARHWDASRPVLNFLLLNPSTADAEHSDPTVTRCLSYAQTWGFGTLIVTNIFAYRSTDPRALRIYADPIGPNNDVWILHAAARAQYVVIGWGTHGALGDRHNEMLALLSDYSLWTLGLTREGYPRHPLYLPRTATPQPFAWR